MSDGRFDLGRARVLASHFIKLVEDVCERVEVAGSIRREIRTVKDIELVVIPKTRPIQSGLFDEGEAQRENLLLSRLNQLVDARTIGKHRREDGTPCWGPKHQMATYLDVPVDIYSATPETWGAIMVIRTGPGDYSRQLVTQREHGGFMPPGMRQARGALWRDVERRMFPDVPDDHFQAQMMKMVEEMVETPTEEAFYEALGIRYAAPTDRFYLDRGVR